MDRLFRVNAPSVVFEIIDGEAVIMDLKNGNYYSSLDSGRLLWEWIAEGHSELAMIEALTTVYAGGDFEIAAAARRFLDDLLKHELVVTANGSVTPPAQKPAFMADSKPVPFAVPQLNAYSDMQDLLLLDPIHDVDDAGWPQQKPANGA